MQFLGMRWEAVLGKWVTGPLSSVMCCILQNERQKDREGEALTENIVVR